ncbi:hypothetical protein Hanom_Chr00s188501g01834051 [Helianthus anomalus]
MALFLFLLLLISHREQPLHVQDDRIRDLPPTPINRSSGGYPRLTSLYKKPFPGGEHKLQDEYVRDYPIHSCPDPP